MKRQPKIVTVSCPGYQTATIKLFPCAVVFDAVSPLWHSVFITDASFNPAALGSPAEILTDCPEDSHCGRLIIDACAAADRLLVFMTEATERDAVIAAVRNQCNTIYYG